MMSTISRGVEDFLRSYRDTRLVLCVRGILNFLGTRREIVQTTKRKKNDDDQNCSRRPDAFRFFRRRCLIL